MLISNKPALTGGQPLAGSGAGAFACGSTLTGAHAGHLLAGSLPRPRWTAASTAHAASGQYTVGVRPQSEQHLTLIAPAFPGKLGPHPVREPEPV